MKRGRKSARRKVADALATAAFRGEEAEIGRLLDAGADVDADGRNWNPLHAAIENGNPDCIRLLLRRGADVEHRAGGLTPLAHAVDVAIDGTLQRGGKPDDVPTDIIALLLGAGADPAPGLGLARTYGVPKVVDLLAKAMKRRRALQG